MAAASSQADRELARLDRKVGKLTTYKVFTGTSTDITTGIVTHVFIDIDHVYVRTFKLSMRDRTDLANAGLNNVEAAWKIRKAYVGEPKKDDEVHLMTTGFKYLVIDADTDRLEADHILYTRRLRV